MKICAAHGLYEGDECKECKVADAYVPKEVIRKVETLEQRRDRYAASRVREVISRPSGRRDWDKMSLLQQRNETVRAEADVIGVCPCCKKEKPALHPWHVFDDRTYVCKACYQFDRRNEFENTFNICCNCGKEVWSLKDWCVDKCLQCYQGWCLKHNCSTHVTPCRLCEADRKDEEVKTLQLVQWNTKSVSSSQQAKRKAKALRLPKDLICKHCGEEKKELVLWTVTKDWVGCRKCYGRRPKNDGV